MILKNVFLFFYFAASLLNISHTGKKTLHGKASYYARKFEGKRTSSGQKYRANRLTAAHRTLPFGTILEVTNQSNGSKAIVRVNDRGPHTRSRVIDVSYKAAKQLGLLSKGSAHVRIKVLSLGSGALLADEESEEDTLSDENTEEVAQNPLQQPIETDSLNQRKFVVIVYDQDGRIKLDSTNSQPKVILVRK